MAKKAKAAAKPKAGKRAKDASENPRAVAGDNSAAEAKKACFNAYRDKLRPLAARLAKAKKDLDDVYADAKRDKIPKKAFAVSDKLLSQNKKAEKGVLDDIKLTLWVAECIGHELARQGDLFAYLNDAPVGASIDAEAEGAQAFRDGSSAKPPHAPGSDRYDGWMKGFYAEQEHKMKTGFKPLEPDKPKRGRKAKAGEPEEAGTDGLGDNWPDDTRDPARPLAH